MNTEIIKEISVNLNIKESQISNTLKMLEEGNTVPFIARYRKESTGGLDEEQIRSISEVYEYQVNLQKRKEDVIRLIDEKGLMTDELKEKIMACSKLVEVEDLYRPYKEKKKTKATDAINNGLEPLAKIMMSFPLNGSVNDIASKYITDKVKTVDEAIMGAKYIIAEWISDNAYYRKYIRNYMFRNGSIVCKKKKNDLDKEKLYEMYYDYTEEVSKIKPHRILAINRAEKEDVITVNIKVDNSKIISFLEEKIIKNNNSFVVDYIKEAISDSYKRLIEPSIEREIRSELTDNGNVSAIKNFSDNLEALLLTPPMKERCVLAFDPGFTNGCKLAVIDKTGNYLTSCVIYPFSKEENAKKVVLDLINKYHVDIVAIGNGTASRESEKFIANIIKENKLNIKYIIVSEAGASIYSTEKIAIEEFPNLSPNERSAVSIGRRLQDPLSELVKVPPEGIGVGLYQHDVPGKDLKERLDFVTSKVVNSVGVNVNTASPSLLKYISGINKTHIDKIIDYRKKVGKINTRKELEKLLSNKTYEQAIGFLRVLEGDNVLDATGIHPESYNLTLNLLKELNLSLNDIGSELLISKLNNIDIEEYKDKLNTDIYTLTDVIESLKKPNRDPRDELPAPILKSDILNIKDLKVGMKLQGTVRNVVDFGAFIDIGLHNDGLVHISKLTDKYIKHPSEVVSVGDIVDCYVLEIYPEKEKVALSLLEVN